jgi:hypothetical protein
MSTAMIEAFGYSQEVADMFYVIGNVASLLDVRQSIVTTRFNSSNLEGLCHRASSPNSADN